MKPDFFRQHTVLLLSLFILFAQTVGAAAIKSKQSGSWNAASTWEGGVVPGQLDDVVIKAGHTVTRNTAFTAHSQLYVYGTLIYQGNVARTIDAGFDIEIDGILRMEGGSLFVGGLVYGDGTFKQTAGNTTFYKAVVLGNTDVQGGTLLFQNINNGALILDKLTLKGAEITTAGTEYLHVTETMDWLHNGKFGGDLQIDEGATLTFAAGNNTFYHKGYLKNYGAITQGAGTLTYYQAVSRIYNYSSWTFNVQANASSGISNVSFYNYGDVIKTGSGGASISKYLGYSTSFLHVQQNGMTIYPSIDLQYGTWQIDAGCTLLVFAVNLSDYVKYGSQKLINNGVIYGKLQMSGGVTTTLEGNGKYEYLEMAKSGANVELAGSPQILEKLTLTDGLLVLNQYDLRMGTADISYFNDLASYIYTNGQGACVRTCKKGSSLMYPVGNERPAPFLIDISTFGVQDDIKVRVNNAFYGEFNGTTPACSEAVTQGVVAHTWTVTPLTQANNLATVIAYWLPEAERSGFDRDHCTLAQYTGNNWVDYGYYPALTWASFYKSGISPVYSFGLFGVIDEAHEADANFISPLPDANQPICAWDDLLLHANTSPNADVYWEGPNGFQSTEHHPVLPGIQPGQAGVYSAKASQYGCPEKQGTVEVVVYPEPIGSVVGPDHTAAGEPVTLTAYGGVGFLWSTGETTQSIIVAPAQTTDYMVTVSNASGCSDQVLHTVQVSGASATHEATDHISVMRVAPNPALTQTVLHVESKKSGKAEWILSDAQGKTIQSAQFDLVEGANDIQIMLDKLPAGVYQIGLKTALEMRAVRIVKHIGE